LKILCPARGCLELEQISFSPGERNYVLTNPERYRRDLRKRVRQRIRRGKGQIRSRAPDYLLYALVDWLIDEVLPVLERYGEQIEGSKTR